MKKSSILLITVLICQCIVFVPSVYGHATIVNTDPVNGQQIETPPNEVTIHYSEGVQLAEISILDSSGNKVSQKPQIGSADNRIVTIPLQEIDSGVYTVSWSVLSVDGHTTSDNFFFIVGNEVPSRSIFLELYSPKEATYIDSIEEPTLRWLILSSLVVIVGMPVSLILITPSATRGPLINKKRKLLRNLLISGAVIISISATMLAVKQMYSVYPSINMENFLSFVSSTLGITWIAKLVLIFGLIGILALNKSWKIWCISAISVGIMVQLTISITSHSTSLIGGAIPFTTDFFHLLASSIWIGGVFLLVLLIPFMRSQENFSRRNTIEPIKKFSILAVCSVSILAITGLVMTSWHVSDFEPMFSTIYGAVLSIKLILLAAAIALGATNRFLAPKLFAKLSDQRFIKSLSNFVRIELAVLLLILVMSGILTTVQPAASEFAEQAQVDKKFSITENIDGVITTIDIIPKQVGLNVFDLYLTRDGEPLTDVQDPRILLTLSEKNVQLPQFDLVEIEPGLYSGFGTLTFGGEWDVRFSSIIENKYTTTRFTVNTEQEMQHDSHSAHMDDEKITSDSFSTLLWYVAFVVVGITSIVLVYELKDLKKDADKNRILNL